MTRKSHEPLQRHQRLDNGPHRRDNAGMGIWIDQAKGKIECIELLKALDERPSLVGVNACLHRIHRISRDWNINTDKYIMLIRSQVLSGNTAAAIEITNLHIKNQRMKTLPLVFISIALWPFRFLGRIVGLGLKQK